MSLSPDLRISPNFATSIAPREAESFYRRDSIFVKVSQDSARHNLPGLYAIFMGFRVELRIGKMDYLVYEYGCLPPLRGRETALEQMLRRHRLWNSLVEVERDYRSQLSAVLRDETAESAVEAA